jgi:hypothetical protein
MRRSGHHIMLAVPTRGQIGWQTVMRLEEIRDATPGLGPIVYQPGNLSVAMTRNRIVERFIESDCSTLVMVDDDVVPPPHALDALDALIPEFGMAAIPHPHPWPNEPSRVVLSAYDLAEGGGYTTATLVDGINEVDAVATGCVAISRAALEATGPAPFRVSHDPSDAITSDDFLFCADLRILGFRIAAWADGWFCDHVTSVSLAPLWERETSGVRG